MPFRTIVGHRRVVSLLSRAIVRETLPPSLLFTGPAGIGKRLAAMAVAEAVNCLERRPSEGIEADACGECACCLRIARGTHPAVVVVEPGDTGTIKIEQVRDVVDRSAYRPFEGRRRVVIIDEADALVAPAQNALLKTLEEPPSASLFILVSSLPDALLPTVRSRCPNMRFGALAPGDVAQALIRDHGYAEAEARAAAAEADGSIGAALAAREIDLAEARAAALEVLQQAARTPDPVRRLDAAKEMTASIAKGIQSGRASGERDQLAVALRALASLVRDLGILAHGADPAGLANADLDADLRRLTAVFDGDRSQRAFAVVDRAIAALERNASPKIVADWLVLEL